MLMSMGWSDGMAIGLSGDLDVPITVVIKWCVSQIVDDRGYFPDASSGFAFACMERS